MSTVTETQTGHYTVYIYTEYAFRYNHRATTVIHDIPAWLVTAIAQRNPYVRIARDWIQETTYTYTLGPVPGASTTKSRLVTEEILQVCEGETSVRTETDLIGNERVMFRALTVPGYTGRGAWWLDVSTLHFPTVTVA